ncbi:hypothetical protein B0I31_102540 [Saccharothrix carnea]|uniref:Uncharacterized protein n=1 Tax=Saccharothrix carnea TaxID=1280637 RepID=A0A2P8IGG9_SACCR|nr:hypothetical protein [Saccharothrix carnea]PSL57561.1 hypothetical protein B0I31_102540 [Saccharothrix carnea]
MDEWDADTRVDSTGDGRLPGRRSGGGGRLDGGYLVGSCPRAHPDSRR